MVGSRTGGHPRRELGVACATPSCSGGGRTLPPGILGLVRPPLAPQSGWPTTH